MLTFASHIRADKKKQKNTQLIYHLTRLLCIFAFRKTLSVTLTTFLLLTLISVFLAADQNHGEEAGGGAEVEKLRPENIWLPPPLQRW